MAKPEEDTNFSTCRLDDFSHYKISKPVNIFPCSQLNTSGHCCYNESVSHCMSCDLSDKFIPELKLCVYIGMLQ